MVDIFLLFFFSLTLQNATFPMNNHGYFEGGYPFNSLPQPPQSVLQSGDHQFTVDNLHQLPGDNFVNYPVAPDVHAEVSSEDEEGSNKDSFYDSDDEDVIVSKLLPVQNKPITSPRTNISHNVQTLENGKEPEMIKKIPPKPLPRGLSTEHENLVKTTPPKPSMEKFVSDSPRSQSPVDNDNTTLPSYEEAMAIELDMYPGSIPPPVPQRVESELPQAITVEAVKKKVKEHGLEAAVSSDEVFCLTLLNFRNRLIGVKHFIPCGVKCALEIKRINNVFG